MDFRGVALPLKPSDVEIVAGYLGCEVAMLRAVMAIESRNRGFQDRRPIILNEPHVFYRQLGAGSKRDQAVAQGLAYRHWRTKPYLRSQAERYNWLEKAMRIDPAAALKSCSWGLGQVMGFNYQVCGFDDVFAFVEAMKHSKGAQVLVIARFIVGNRLQRHLRNKKWSSFARGYNGAGYKSNGYHTKLRTEYGKRPVSERFVPSPPNEERLRELLGSKSASSRPVPPDPEIVLEGDEQLATYQQKLADLGFYEGEPDGLDGTLTKVAVTEYQNTKAMLDSDGILGPLTKAQIDADVLRLRAKEAPPPPDIPKPEDIPPQPPQSGFSFARFLQWILRKFTS